MNNYETAVDATTSAYSSQGSALREQEQYMQSYEYQISVLGSSFTELALIMEERFVGDAMYLIITSAVDLIEVIGRVVETFGLLPPVLALATGAIVTFKTSLGGFASLGVTAVVTALGWALEKLVGNLADARRATEEAERSMESSMDLYNSYGNNIDDLIDRYEELHEAQENRELDLDEQQEYNILINDLSTMMPSVIEGVDASGEVHLKNADAIRTEAQALDELSQLHREAELAGMELDFKELEQELSDAMEKTNEYAEQYVNSRNEMKLAQEDFDAYSKESLGFTTDNAETRKNIEQNLADEYVKSANAYSTSQFEQMEIMQRSMLAIGDYSVKMLGLNGELENVSTTGQATIRNYVRANEELFDSMDFEEIQVQSINFGRIVTNEYNKVAESLDGVNSDRAIEAFDSLVQALPEEALNQTTRSVEDIQTDFEALGNVVSQVASGAEVDTKSLVDTLVESGMEVDTATRLVIDLGTEFENQSIQTAQAEEEIASYNEELAYTKDLALETIDPLSQLFGVSSDEVKSMRSHIDLLGLLQTQYGDTWAEADQGQESLKVLADYFGQSTDFVIEHIDVLDDVLTAIDGATISLDDNGNRFIEFEEGVSESIQNIAKEFMFGENSMQDFSTNFVQETGIVTKSAEELGEMMRDLSLRFDGFAETGFDQNSTEWNLLLTEMNSQLQEIKGSYIAVQDETGKWKLQMADGSESPYLNYLNEAMDTYGMNLHAQVDGTGEFYELLVQGPSGDELITISDLSRLAEAGTFAIEETEEALRGLYNESTTEEDRQTFIETFHKQLELFGQDITTTTNDAGELYLEFQGGGTSPWLDSINELIKELGLKINFAETETGEFKIALETEEGETIFSQTAYEAELAEEKIDKAGKKADEVTEKERNPVKLEIDDEDFNKAIDENDGRIDVMTQEQNYVMLGADDTDFNEKADSAEGKAKELEKERVTQLKLNIDEEGFNVTVEKVSDLRLELMDIDEELAELERILRVTNEQMGGLMTNTENINNARSAIRSLKDDVDEAIIKMGELYEKFASGGIDTSGFQTDANTILNTVAGVEDSIRRLQRAVAGLNSTMGALNQAFDISPMVAYRAGMAVHATGIETRMNELNGVVRTAFNAINSTLSNGNRQLENATARTSDSLGKMTILYRTTKEMVVRYIEEMGITITKDYTDTVVSILATTMSFNKSMNIAFSAIGKTVRDQMQRMGKDMISVFKSSTDSIVSTAGSLPTRIGNGITANMSNATNSMTSLARNMVKRFKSELGIHSPSRVFEGLGGDVIDGLVNGLSGSDITNLGQSVFSDFSDGAISTIDQIKSYMTFEPVTSGSFGGAFVKTSGFGRRKSPGGIGSTNHKGVDFGAPVGTPIPAQMSGKVVASGYHGARGNYVIVESGSGMRQVYQHNSRNLVSVGQTVGKGQILGLVGSTGASTGPHLHYEVHVNGVPIDPERYFRGFAEGGFVDRKELAWHGEEGLEAIIPLMPHRKERGLDLWAETGEILGMNSSLLEMLIRSQRRSGSFSSGGGFSGLDGEAGGGETATATSGTVAPDYSSIMRNLGTADQPMFSGMAGGNKLEELYKRDMHAINVGRFSGMLTKANTELTALMKNTLKYRNALEEVNYQERKLRDATQQQLNASIKRQSQIEKELGKLRNTKKHTEDQRKKYNQLQQEFDKNSESIMSMENEIRKLNISMDQRKVEIYTDYIGQLTKGFEDLTSTIDKTISDLQFSLDYLTLTDENNVGAQLKIQYDILRESIRLENTLMNNVNKLQAEYSKAVSKYGKNSQQALLARDELYKSESAYQSSVLDRVKLEQSVAKTRENVANEGIDTLKSYYKQTQTMTEKAIELERKALEKQHEDKMSMYDDEIAKIESVYDTRIAEMDAQEAEDAYNETISDLNTQRAELMQQISRASRDTSLEGRKRLAELQSQLGEVNSEIETTQKDRQDQMYREAIERQKQEQIQAIEMQKEKAEKEQEIKLESLDKQLADAQSYAERMINDEAMWDKLRNEFIAGNGTGLASLTNEMTEQMSRFMSGDFRGVSMGYDELSDEDKELFSEEILLEISNLMLQSSESMERFVSTANERVQDVGYVAGKDYNVGSMTTSSGGNISTSAKGSPTIPPAPKPAPKPVADNRTYTIKKGDTLWDLAQKYYGNPYQWTKIAQANANPDPRKLQIGRKLIIPFDTGGYTGDWVTNEGRLALLHKKELVLNESQTRDILDVAKIVDKISGFIPKISASRPNLGSSSITNTGDNYNLETLVLEIPDFKGDEKDVRRVFDNMAKSLKKLGK